MPADCRLFAREQDGQLPRPIADALWVTPDRYAPIAPIADAVVAEFAKPNDAID